MRFLEFVPCGRRPPLRQDRIAPRLSAEEAAPPVVVNPLPDDAAAAATAATSTSGEKRRRRRAGGASGSGATSGWRPTLGAISEDGVIRAEAAAEKGTRLRGTEIAGKGKAKAPPPPRSRSRDHRQGDYRNYTPPAAFPSFAPTAFFF